MTSPKPSDEELRDKIVKVLMVKQPRPLPVPEDSDSQAQQEYRRALHHALWEAYEILSLIA